jgi:hypothetical protein
MKITEVSETSATSVFRAEEYDEVRNRGTDIQTVAGLSTRPIENSHENIFF